GSSLTVISTPDVSYRPYFGSIGLRRPSFGWTRTRYAPAGAPSPRSGVWTWNVPSFWISPAAFDLSSTDSRDTVPPASSTAGVPSSYTTVPSTGYSRLPDAHPAAARAAARATARDRGRGGAGITGTSAGAGGSIRRDDLTVVAADQQAEGGLRDGDAHGPDAAV